LFPVWTRRNWTAASSICSSTKKNQLAALAFHIKKKRETGCSALGSMCGSRRFFWVWLPTYRNCTLRNRRLLARAPWGNGRAGSVFEHKCVRELHDRTHVLRGEYAPAAARRGRAVFFFNSSLVISRTGPPASAFTCLPRFRLPGAWRTGGWHANGARRA
jgi:hypothetical protein